jgi:hypothetical protein
MKSTVIILYIMFFSIAQQAPANQESMGNEIRQVQCTLEFSEEDVRFGMVEEYDLIHLTEAGVHSEPGKPVLPQKTIRVAIPANTEAVDVDINILKSQTIAGSFHVMPGQHPLPTSSATGRISIRPDQSIYERDHLYPENIAFLRHQSDLAGQEIVEITVFPLQYNPKKGELLLHNELEIVVRCAENASGATITKHRESYWNFTERQYRNYQRMIESMVVNPEDVIVDPPLDKTILGLPSGNYEHVIVTSSTLSSSFQELVDWHTQKGVRDTVVTTSWIYSNYSGSSNAEKIRNFISDAAGTWGSMYFLLGGEHSTVPFVYRTYYDQNTPSDQYYSDYDEDWTAEVFVGRVSADNSTEVTRFVDKVLRYEKDPPLTNYPLDVLLIGMDADWYTPCEELKETIDGYIPSQFTVTKVYDSQHSNHKTEAINALNDGQIMVNHADHAGETAMGVGAYNHSQYLSNSDIDGLTNNDRTSIVVSLGCDPNAMDHSDCISEHWVIYNASQAGVAFTGNTRHGYYYWGMPESLSGLLDRDWWKAVFLNGQRTLGEAMAWSKHQFSHSDDVSKHCEWTFNLLGEPSMSELLRYWL